MSEDLGAVSRVIGVGHPFRRDDGVGPWLAAELARRGIEATAHTGDGAGLVEVLAQAAETGEALLFADATQSGAPPGTVVVLDAHAAPLPPDTFRNSTHEFGLAAAVETARALGLLPASVVIVGIEGQDFTFGDGLSAPVEAAALAVLDRLVRALGAESGRDRTALFTSPVPD
ncbi:hydrogenase maturation protease [Palleronia sp. KMU-117]|uniref:hydrogenase maturation protease n=1 Tax=Palleronia sp. KMU-117 TaxID=3434108 RepID=UPI003D758FEB